MVNVLVVEDHEEWCSILKEDLEFGGYSVETAFSLEIALEKLEQKIFQVVITDIGLSKEPEDVSGIELLKWIKDHCATTKALAISGRAALGLDKEKFKEDYGVLAYIDRKNYDSEAFLDLVRKAVIESEQAALHLK